MLKVLTDMPRELAYMFDCQFTVLLSFSYKLARWEKIEKTRARKKLT